MKTTADIRRSFLSFFASKHHQIVESSSLVPYNDPTLLFTNAGMNQFKDTFLGLEFRSYHRATSAQRCVRAGGKHNDLENVGFTTRHHTFFEMLGNFSFGNYFKEQAIQYAWELLTSKEWFNLDADKLLVTVYESDDESYDIWLNKIGIPAGKIIRIGDKGEKYKSDNFWQMGDTGPCGPCSEIFYDHGPSVFGGPPGSKDEDGDRFVEIWNLVFMQFNRLENGQMEPLPLPSVDTGCGIERLAAVLQGVTSNYDIDIFKYLIVKVQNLTKQNTHSNSLNVIADHARSATFLVGDGVIPSNEGRGYVLRRIIRRALRHGYLLGLKESFLYKLVDDVIYIMADAAAYLENKKEFIKKIIYLEEEQFARTIEHGLNIINNEMERAQNTNKVISGEVAFKLYDTYGFPLDLSIDLCKEHNLTLDIDSFNTLMEQQKQNARKNDKFKFDYNKNFITDLETVNLSFVSVSETAKVLAIYKDGESVQELLSGDEALIITDKTPFYGESGGQVGDVGYATNDHCEFDIKDTQKYNKAIGHHGTLLAGNIKIGDELKLQVNEQIRHNTSLNHSATHLLHYALRKVLGNHVTQKGSLVNDKSLRLDVSHPEIISPSQLLEIESLVNELILKNLPVVIKEMPIDEAKKLGAMALFGEKYDDIVRVVSIGPSIELCGGIHVFNTGEIGSFRINSESSVASGIRRIEAVVGKNALAFVDSDRQTINEIAMLLKSPKDLVLKKIELLQKQVKKLEKDLDKNNERLSVFEVSSLVSKSISVGDNKFVVDVINDFNTKTLKLIVDNIKNTIKSGIVILACNNESGCQLIVGVTKNLINEHKAGNIISELASRLNGKGGGKPELAMANIENSVNLLDELRKFSDELKNKF